MSTCIPAVAFPCAQLICAQGTRYDFEILAQPVESRWAFELRAFDRISGCWSVINTVNAVMGEFLTDEQEASDPCWTETPWMVSMEECVRLIQVASDRLSDERSLAAIETALDEDRAEGEWQA